ncbi:protein adenylyltransferase SelO [Colwellia sp. UCD-KL20]|uniref:protein adenylyltransferase SelO n=1 Tax=Colwellia sp. UCD-KL20 TaxID=1917165 RepID=UPI0009706FD1|nr:YdiU family protein [Colwellia sp. UCD-KL20]
MQKLNLNFNNTFRNNLPCDPIEETYPRQVEHAAYSQAMPINVKQPKTIIVATEVAELFNFTKEFVDSEDFAQIFSGNQLIDGMEPYAMCYGGFQFGNWAGQLGDGRAINLGEVITEKHGSQTLQLKGSGPTPYSRTADGFAVLRSSVREFLCSEAMYHLGIPTTRALSLCLTGEHVVRDIMYDGNAKPELGAVVCRVSPSFMRFGSIQLPAMRRDLELLTQLVNYSITHDFPTLLAKNIEQGKDPVIDKDVYLAWFDQICDTTCDLVVHWMRVGFVHGVMNTDNMSLIGETIDFGPYGWIDNFDLSWTPNTTDSQNRRYRFGAQADVSLWNLCQLANAIIPLVGSTEELQTKVESYSAMYTQKWYEMMMQKLGLTPALPQPEQQTKETDITLCKNLEALLSEIETDMTIFYRLLASYNFKDANINTLTEDKLIKHFTPCYYDIDRVTDAYLKKLVLWMNQYQERFAAENYDNTTRAIKMNQVNPKFVLRNYLSQQAIDKAENGDFSEIKQLHALLKNPYDEQPEFEQYAGKRPDWAKNKVGCSMLSCSS